MNELGHIQWIVYDADEDALAVSNRPKTGQFLLVNKCIAGKNSHVPFHLTADAAASSMFSPALTAADYTLMLSDGSARVWGKHSAVTKVTDVEACTLDSLLDYSTVPPVDFLSMDVQGAELAILEGASDEFDKGQIIGVLCETEFARLYTGQPLFCDIQSFLVRYDFRLCDIYSKQYMNSGLFPHEAQGQGFLTVGESLFLRDIDLRDQGAFEKIHPESAVVNLAQVLKLAAVAVAFDQVDYAVSLCRNLESSGWLNLNELADRLRWYPKTRQLAKREFGS